MLPATLYAEVLVGPIRVGAAAVRSLQEFIDDLAMHIAPLTPEIARRAAELRANGRLRIPDAFVVATGDIVGAATVLTADNKWLGVTPRVRII